MIEYDPKLIQTFAQTMYSWARTLIVLSVVGGVLTGAFFGVGVGVDTNAAVGWVVGIVAAVVLGLLGYVLISFTVLLVRMCAQLSLCLERIEANTRPQVDTRPLGEPAWTAAG